MLTYKPIWKNKLNKMERLRAPQVSHFISFPLQIAVEVKITLLKHSAFIG